METVLIVANYIKNLFVGGSNAEELETVRYLIEQGGYTTMSISYANELETVRYLRDRVGRPNKSTIDFF